MPKFEGAPNMNSTELNSNEVSAGIGARKKQERELTSEELEELKIEKGQEQKAEKPELSPEEQAEQADKNIEIKQGEIIRLKESIENTKSALNVAREKLGLSPIQEDPPSIFSEKDKLEELQVEQESLEKQKEELISQQEKERLVNEEKEKILQEKIDEVFKEFEGLSFSDFESIFKSGKTAKGENVDSKSMGPLDPELAQSLAKAFKEGIKLLPEILKVLPDLLKKFDEDLTKEATERVDKRLEEEKVRMEEDQKKEEKPEEIKLEEKAEIPEDEAVSNETGSEVIPGGTEDL
jgi:hypothetical protein